MIIHRPVEVLPVSGMSCIVILGALDIKVWNPAKLTINISVFGYPRVVWHSRSLDFVHFIGIRLSLWFHKNRLLALELFVEILSIVSVILLIEEGRRVMVPLDPLLIRRSQHSIIRILLHNHLDGGLCISRISCAHTRLLFKNTREPLTPQRRLSIERGNWGSEFRIYDNVFGVGHCN